MNMNKKLLKETQPVVYKTLSNALTKDHLAHAYLFEGDKSAPKKETALLFAQSLVCQHKDEASKNAVGRSSTLYSRVL